LAVALRCETGRARPYAARLRADARRLMALVGVEACELSIVIADDSFVHALNREFRGKDRPTDVLSFSQLEQSEPEQADSVVPAAGTALGDVVISLDTACRQARRLGVTRAARLRTLLVHGLLHLLGYDHERSVAEARRMFARERELAAALQNVAGGDGRRRQGRKRALQGRGTAALVSVSAKRHKDRKR
jgi:rRNA maturation RNase YbeY